MHTSPPPPGAHGGDAAAIANWLGVPVGEVLDLSASLNPFAPDVARRSAAHLSALTRYPDDRTATNALGSAIGCDPERLILTNGGAEAIALVADEVGSASLEDPTFSLYGRHLGELRSGPPTWRPNPSSPLGRLADSEDRSEVWDEAFWPLSTGTWTRGDDDSWRLGSLTKLWACPGLRLGYAIAPTLAAAKRLRRRRPRWAVNGLASALVPELLSITDLVTWAAWIADARSELVESLNERGLEVTDTDAPWVLVRHEGLRAGLARQGVVVRDCASFGLDGTHRIAVPGTDGRAKLLDALDRMAPLGTGKSRPGADLAATRGAAPTPGPAGRAGGGDTSAGTAPA